MTQTATNIASETPTTASRLASLAASADLRREPLAGLIALEQGSVHHGALGGARTSAEGDLIFTTAATGWG